MAVVLEGPGAAVVLEGAVPGAAPGAAVVLKGADRARRVSG
ncbi:MAG TPA: hypothetical protein VKZ83_10075 [Phototrophicaceae bacterium]|nr:hypothetical protein [Phototrophicaceae bacterium]